MQSLAYKTARNWRLGSAFEIHVKCQIHFHRLSFVLDCPRYLLDHFRLMPLKNKTRGGPIGGPYRMSKFAGITYRKAQRT